MTASKAFSLAHMAHSADTEFSSPAVAPARKAGWVHAHCARLRSPYAAQDQPFASNSTNPDRKGSDSVKESRGQPKKDALSQAV